MRPTRLAVLFALPALCLVSGCSHAATLPSRATQSIRGVSVTVETTTTGAAMSMWEYGLRPVQRDDGQRLAYVYGTASNSTDASVAVSEIPAVVIDTGGAKLQRWDSYRVVLTASGRPVLARLVVHWYRDADAVGPSGKVLYLAGFKRPKSEKGPITVVWTLGGGRRFVFKLRSP